MKSLSIDAINTNLIEHHRGDIFARLLRNLNTIPQDDYRGSQMWELFMTLSDFVLKIEPDSMCIPLIKSLPVGYLVIFSFNRKFHRLFLLII